eukprot:TRINITY_DN1141_c2_g4_i1.p1 TRINITY_DN1141_c2_g4~~TRINITY_DN1141_c2_g4_i1.p1  ORF type:complete len:520 (+),score=59.27 TRINITY_DN1141_c2_g4_i1:73-1632(+)
MKIIGLAGASGSTEAEGCSATNALQDDASAFKVKEENGEGSWSCSLKGFVEDPICLVQLHVATEGGLSGVVLDIMADATNSLWSSPIQIPTNHTILHIHVPNIKGRRLRVRMIKEYSTTGILTFRYVQCHIAKGGKKYRLSRSILTIDKFSVAQPFSLTDLAHSTAYGNLFTTSACYELSTQESQQDEREQEALNLTHHLSGIWDGASFNHGSHLGTVRVVFLAIIESVKQIFLNEPKLLDIHAPSYVFGDIHGNFQDLLYFMSNLIPFKHIKYSSHNYLFLGDYVDRGRHDVECLAYLFALKVQAPHKIFLCRGNHEDRKQNCKLEESFLKHCTALFGKTDGHEVWVKCNEVFDVMPLCAVVGEKLFACHGGVPRMPCDDQGKQLPIRPFMAKMPKKIDTICDSEDVYQQMACDLLWADPAQDRDVEGFECNEARGCSTVFGQAAVEEFLDANGFECLFRAHQCFSFGVNISKCAKVITLFTSSNYCDNNSCAGCALVTGDHKILLLMKEHSPAIAKK